MHNVPHGLATGFSQGTAWGRRGGIVTLAGLALAVPASLTIVGSVHAAAAVSVIVRTDAGQMASAKQEVAALGGQVQRDLGIIGGFTAAVPGDRVGELGAFPGVAAVSSNASIQLFSIGGYDPAADVNSVYNVTQMTGAQAYWKAGFTGQGVDVALIDTGVAPVNGLTASGKVVLGPDISFDSQYQQLAESDAYGHGTHMAGIIAGRDSGTVTGNYAGNTNNFIGMAPDARIVSVKIGDHTGAADVSQVIAAIDWVVQHRTDNGMNIRVLNLSFGTDSSQPYTLDPLAFATEQAWKHGIVVVAAVGNAGATSQRVSDPASDPYVIAAGAADTQGTVTTADDTVASFSSVGDGTRNPDLLAPGVHVASLRDPGSYLDTQFGSVATVGTRFFRGSGTSQATAVVSGAAALVISQHPSYTPDQVKFALTGSATPVNTQKSNGKRGDNAQGSGEINLAATLKAGPTAVSPLKQSFVASRGTGTLQGARGSLALTANGVTLSGEKDIFGKPFVSSTMAALETSGSAWSGGTWNGSAWSGSAWSGSAWSGSAWSGSAWSGSAWSGSAWSGSAWSGSAWSGSAWSGSAWSGNGWSGSAWSGSAWSGSAWSGSAWSGNAWSGSAWSGSAWS